MSRLSLHPADGKKLHRSYQRSVAIGLILSVAAHAAFFELFPAMQSRDYSSALSETRAIELPPRIEIPPPPEPVTRPATPRVAEAQVDEDITIAPTTFRENPVETLPPPPKARSVSVKDRPSFIPRDVDPRATNDDEIRRLLNRYYPPMLLDAGIGGTVTLWLFVNKEGIVERVQTQKSSGYDAMDRAAERVARNMKFRPATSRDRPIGVWVARRIIFRAR